MRPTSLFDQHPTFTPHPTAPLSQEFARLAQHMGWRKGSHEWRANKRRAYLQEFARHWGEDASRLDVWRRLCADVGVVEGEAGLGSVTKCKKALKTVHVNLVELVDAIRVGRRVRRFRNVAELKAYTNAGKNRVFPRDVAKEDGFVNVLLRVLS
ncbi:hypothetical protein LTR66_010429 [Elasticomyces elasticus]|nr:hypothetical protein LTR66_010429 [Elasticomyces elasticus]KAK5004627.1 hypothetical protein LTR28_008664 [Elasticomyces elasticus]